MSDSYCYVGDVLGYKYMIKNQNIKDQEARVTELINFVKISAKKFNITDHDLRIISDMIIVVADKDDECLNNLLCFAQYMLNEGVPKSFPLRGAIVQGEAKLVGDIPLGTAFLDAYNLANRQNWIGTCCEIQRDIIEKFCSVGGLAIFYEPPMKSGENKFMPVISWNIPFYGNLYSNMVNGGLSPDIKLDWKELIKIQNTLMFSLFLKIRDANCNELFVKYRKDGITAFGEISEERVRHEVALWEQDPSWVLDKMIEKSKILSESEIAKNYPEEFWPKSWKD
jgi:hypothetical protein